MKCIKLDPLQITPHLDGGLHDLEVLSRTGKSSTRPDPGYERVNLPRGLCPQLGTRSLSVDLHSGSTRESRNL